MDDLQARLDALDAKATRGVWNIVPKPQNCFSLENEDGFVIGDDEGYYPAAMVQENAEFIAALANAYRANKLVPASALAEAQADNSRLREALGLALGQLVAFEPGDSRAVSNEFVAMAAIHAGIRDREDECLEIIRSACAAQGGGE